MRSADTQDEKPTLSGKRTWVVYKVSGMFATKQFKNPVADFNGEEEAQAYATKLHMEMPFPSGHTFVVEKRGDQRAKAVTVFTDLLARFDTIAEDRKKK